VQNDAGTLVAALQEQASKRGNADALRGHSEHDEVLLNMASHQTHRGTQNSMKTTKPNQLDKNRTDSEGPSHEEISLRAYQLWEEGGKPDGSHEDDWYRAEHELRLQPDAPGGAAQSI
jgi:hypothetical protein